MTAAIAAVSASPDAPRRTTSGRGPRRDAGAWARSVTDLMAEVGVDYSVQRRVDAPGKPYAVRLRETDADGTRVVGGCATLTLYSTGSWTWGGDADVVAYVREPLDRHGVLP